MPEHKYKDGALIFKLTPDEKKEIEYRHKVDILEEKVAELENKLEKLLMEVNSCGKYIYP